MTSLWKRIGKTWLVIALSALISSAFVQRYVEHRRVAGKLTWTDPEQKQALEIGFMALGGFRGILADVLWIRAIRQQDTKQYYELKLLCDMILRLQPTFTSVHAFQAYNMSYNIAFHAETCEDKWYWVRSGLATLEKGLERNKSNYAMWFELAYHYLDRLGDIKMGDCMEIRDRELPRLDDLTEKQRERVFLGEKTWQSGRARPDEHRRFAAYYFWKAMETRTDPMPLRTEREFGHCLDKLGHFRSKMPLDVLRKLMEEPEWKNVAWDDWGSEDWWVEVISRMKQRGADDPTITTNLRFCMYQQMDLHYRNAINAERNGDTAKASAEFNATVATFKRFQGYFPDDKRTMEQVMKQYQEYRARQLKRR